MSGAGCGLLVALSASAWAAPPCATSAGCREDGRCGQGDEGCVVRDDADCRASAGCAERGACVAKEEVYATEDGMGSNLVCGPDQDADCARSEACRREGRCRLVDWACVAADAADCRALCATDGRCAVVDGACSARGAQDCLASAACLRAGRCLYRGDRCVAGPAAEVEPAPPASPEPPAPWFHGRWRALSGAEVLLRRPARNPGSGGVHLALGPGERWRLQIDDASPDHGRVEYSSALWIGEGADGSVTLRADDDRFWTLTRVSPDRMKIVEHDSFAGAMGGPTGGPTRFREYVRVGPPPAVPARPVKEWTAKRPATSPRQALARLERALVSGDLQDALAMTLPDDHALLRCARRRQKQSSPRHIVATELFFRWDLYATWQPRQPIDIGGRRSTRARPTPCAAEVWTLSVTPRLPAVPACFHHGKRLRLRWPLVRDRAGAYWLAPQGKARLDLPHPLHPSTRCGLPDLSATTR